MTQQDELRGIITHIEVISGIAMRNSMRDGKPKHHEKFYQDAEESIGNYIAKYFISKASVRDAIPERKFTNIKMDDSPTYYRNQGYNQALDDINEGLSEEGKKES